jgi:thiamine monophosphate synthase|tara:strand:- start:628 stop:1182 length:555 start_codon:yes stop_codon:yes gene_type:complete
MFIIKDNYYLYIENSSSINFNKLKKNKKISIIYRNNGKQEELFKLKKLKKECKIKDYKLYIANNSKLAAACKADGVYISSYNKKIYLNSNVIGSAHNYQQIYEKQKQGCKTIILSRLFKTNYQNKQGYYGITKFNIIFKNCNLRIIPLGGINSSNLLKLNLVLSKGLALLSEVKKKPVITNRLF